MSDEQTKPRENYMERTVRLTAELTALKAENEHMARVIGTVSLENAGLTDEIKSLREQVKQIEADRLRVIVENTQLRAYNDNSMVNKRNIGDIIIENQALRDQVGVTIGLLNDELNDDSTNAVRDFIDRKDQWIKAAIKTLEAKAERDKLQADYDALLVENEHMARVIGTVSLENAGLTDEIKSLRGELDRAYKGIQKGIMYLEDAGLKDKARYLQLMFSKASKGDV